MKHLSLVLFGLICSVALAQQGDDDYAELPVDREPQSLNSTTAPVGKKVAGTSDEEDLSVQSKLPEAALKTDARSLQREVYKTLYNQELKDQDHDAAEEE